MTKLTKMIEIEAAPEKVFAFINDLKKENEISKGFAEGELTSKGPIGVGSTIHYVAKAGGSQAEWDAEITEFVENKKVAMRSIGASKFKFIGVRTLEPTAKGTKFTSSMDYQLPYSILGRVVDKLRVRKDMEKSMDRTLASMKKAIEAES